MHHIGVESFHSRGGGHPERCVSQEETRGDDQPGVRAEEPHVRMEEIHLTPPS